MLPSTPSSSPKRILHVISLIEGGAGRGVLEILNRFRSDPRYEVRLCVLGYPPTDMSLAPAADIEFLNAPLHHRSRLVHRIAGLRRVITQWQPHLLHSHLWPSALTAALVAPQSLPHLIHIRDTSPGLKSQRWGASLRRIFLRRICRNPHVRFVSVSAAAAAYSSEMLGIDSHRIRTVINGVEVDRFLAVPRQKPTTPRRFVIASAGRLVADKGFDGLLQAISQINQPRDSFLVRIAGTGTALESLRTLARNLGLVDSVEFTGQLSDMPGFLAQADLFVHTPVAAEGLSRAIIEAQAAGCPVVTIEHTGAREVIDDGTTGFIVPPGDPTALSRSIEQLMTRPDLVSRMGIHARQQASQRFTTQRVVSELAEIYAEMLK